MNLDQLQVLKIINEEGSFSKASERLNKAKSAISYAMSNLEDELGLLLIDRSSYRPVLTSYGKQLLEKSLPVLESFEKLEMFAGTLSKNQELKLHLSMSALWPINKITPVLMELGQKYPETEIMFTTEVLSGEQLLLMEKVDMAIVAHLENRVDIEYRQIGEVSMPNLISANHPMADKKDLKKEDLSNFPQIVVRSTLPQKGKSFGLLKEGKKWNVDDLDSKLKLILSGLGWGRLPDHIANEYIQRQCLKEINPVEENKVDKIKIYLARRKNAFHGIVSHYLWENI